MQLKALSPHRFPNWIIDLGFPFDPPASVTDELGTPAELESLLAGRPDPFASRHAAAKLARRETRIANSSRRDYVDCFST